MNNEKEIRNVGKLIILHLFPGAVLSIIYILIMKTGYFAEWPKLVVAGLSVGLSIIPLELGYLLYTARKETGSYNIFKILGLKSKIKTIELIVLTLLLFVITGLLMTVLKPVSNYLLSTVFHWVPSWYNWVQDMSLFNRYWIIIAIFVNLFIFAILAPVIEELYFRGYLLSRMKWMGKYGVLLNVALFSAYHFWSPWLIVTRFLAMLPLYYFVYRKDSIKLGMLVHCLANFTDVVALITLL